MYKPAPRSQYYLILEGKYNYKNMRDDCDAHTKKNCWREKTTKQRQGFLVKNCTATFLFRTFFSSFL